MVSNISDTRLLQERQKTEGEGKRNTIRMRDVMVPDEVLYAVT